MNNEKKESGIFEVDAFNKWAFIHNDKIEEAKKVIVPNTQCPLFKKNINVKTYIAKIVIYSLSYENGIEAIINEEPKKWTMEPNYVHSASDFYSIQGNKGNKQIIIATSIKDSNNNPFYLIFSENEDKYNQPWRFDKITTCTNHIMNEPKCLTDYIKADIIENSIDIDTSTIDSEHILSDKEESKGIYRFPVVFQNLEKHRNLLFMIITNSIKTQKQNIKSTIRYEKNIGQIVSCHYLPLDFSSYGGNNYELYACLRKAEGPGNKFVIPTILTYDMVYSQLLEKPKIDHWTYALCKFEENEIKKENQELKKRNQELEEKLKLLERN